MTKQEEIREEIAQRLFNIRQPDEHFECLWENRQNAWYCEADKILSYLHSQGIVIRGESLGFSHPHLADYFTVESLIKE